MDADAPISQTARAEAEPSPPPQGLTAAGLRGETEASVPPPGPHSPGATRTPHAERDGASCCPDPCRRSATPAAASQSAAGSVGGGRLSRERAFPGPGVQCLGRGHMERGAPGSTRSFGASLLPAWRSRHGQREQGPLEAGRRPLAVREHEALDGPGGGGSSREACSEVALSTPWRGPGQQGLRRKRGEPAA